MENGILGTWEHGNTETSEYRNIGKLEWQHGAQSLSFFGEMKHGNNSGEKTIFGPIGYGNVCSAFVALIDLPILYNFVKRVHCMLQ